MMKQLSMELSTLLQQAKYNESKINAPRSNLEQAQQRRVR